MHLQAALHKQHARPSAHTANGPKRQLSQAVVEDSVDPFAAAPSCRRLPTASNATADASGRLWGMLNNASCAFKDVAGHVLFYVDYTPGEWLSTPACQAPPFPDNSVADSRFKVCCDFLRAAPIWLRLFGEQCCPPDCVSGRHSLVCCRRASQHHTICHAARADSYDQLMVPHSTKLPMFSEQGCMFQGRSLLPTDWWQVSAKGLCYTSSPVPACCAQCSHRCGAGPTLEPSVRSRTISSSPSPSRSATTGCHGMKHLCASLSLFQHPATQGLTMLDVCGDTSWTATAFSRMKTSLLTTRATTSSAIRRQASCTPLSSTPTSECAELLVAQMQHYAADNAAL